MDIDVTGHPTDGDRAGARLLLLDSGVTPALFANRVEQIAEAIARGRAIGYDVGVSDGRRTMAADVRVLLDEA